MRAEFEIFDHTADMGVLVRAESMEGLVGPAVEGLYAAIGELVTSGAAVSRAYDLTGGEPALLLRDLLTELLFAFERDGLRAVQTCVLEFSQSRLNVEAKLEPVAEDNSLYHREVKAVTYHELEIRPIDGGYEARYIVDI